MAIINKVEQRAYLEQGNMIRLQVLIYCFFKGISITEHELKCLALLAQQGAPELTVFCNYIREQKLYASAQTVRNVINKFEKKALVVKEGKKSKRVRIHPDMKVQTSGNILLDLKFAHVL